MDPHPGNGIKVTAPGGISLEATGRYVSLYVAVILLGVLVYTEHQDLVMQHTEMLKMHARTNCILSIDTTFRAEALRYGDPCDWLTLRWREIGRP